MDRGSEKQFTVGELARRGGVTVRTLQYYDSCGLLSPSEYTEGGRRLYGRKDVVRLQQILFLKSMGFSLEEIRDKVLPTESAEELAQAFEQQRKVFAEQIAHIEQTVAELDKLIEEVRLGNEVDIDRLLFMTRATRSGNPLSFLTRHFGKEQMANLSQRLTEDDAGEFRQSVQNFTDELIALYRRGTDPESAEGQRLASKWWELMMAMTGNDPSQIRNMSVSVVRESNWPPGSEDLKEATLTFLRHAILAYLKENDIRLP